MKPLHHPQMAHGLQNRWTKVHCQQTVLKTAVRLIKIYREPFQINHAWQPFPPTILDSFSAS
jgi:hypothetical protein